MSPTKIFISSSSDLLEEERLCLKDFEEHWNSNKHPENPIKIIKWETLNKSRTLNEDFQSGINPYIVDSDLIIFLFANRLGVHTNAEFNLAKEHKKFVRILLKEPLVPSLHKQSIKWLNDFIKLRKFIESINNNVFTGTGDGPIVGMSDFKLQLTDCIEEYITHKKQDEAYQLGQKQNSRDEYILSAFSTALASMPEDVMKEILKKTNYGC